jgi:hypothetical protein
MDTGSGWDEEKLSYAVILVLNGQISGGWQIARHRAVAIVTRAINDSGAGESGQSIDDFKSSFIDGFLFARLSRAVIQAVVRFDRAASNGPQDLAITCIWPDFLIVALGRPNEERTVSAARLQGGAQKEFAKV